MTLSLTNKNFSFVVCHNLDSRYYIVMKVVLLHQMNLRMTYYDKINYFDSNLTMMVL
ncbi:Uncharacterised protein [Chlamydia trachomatis]|nr:Uncharacterised protein [Chlamydia trachomatis]